MLRGYYAHMESRSPSPAAVELGVLLKEGRFAAAVSPLSAATVLNVPLDSLLNIEHGMKILSLRHPSVEKVGLTR